MYCNVSKESEYKVCVLDMNVDWIHKRDVDMKN